MTDCKKKKANYWLWSSQPSDVNSIEQPLEKTEHLKYSYNLNVCNFYIIKYMELQERQSLHSLLWRNNLRSELLIISV